MPTPLKVLRHRPENFTEKAKKPQRSKWHGKSKLPTISLRATGQRKRKKKFETLCQNFVAVLLKLFKKRVFFGLRLVLKKKKRKDI